MKSRILKLRSDLGATGLAALGLLAAAAVFMLLVLQPLEERNRGLQASVPTRSDTPVQGTEKLGAVYRYLAKPEQTTDWLAKLYAIGAATGVQLNSATYKTQAAGSGPMQRTEIVVPLTGSYSQMRDFLKRSLAEIPVMSLDQISLRRENRRDGTLQAEVRLTLHMVKS